MNNTILCISLSVLAYSMLNIGMVLQKRGAAMLPAIEGQHVLQNIKNFLTNGSWLIGFVLVNLYVVPFFVALQYGPISLVTPMIGVGLIILCIFSIIVLKEAVSLKMVIAIGITIAGVVIFSVITPPQQNELSWFSQTELLWHGITIVWILVLLAGMSVLPAISKANNYQFADVSFGVASGFAASLGMIIAKLIAVGLKDFSWSLLLTRWPIIILLAVFIGVNTISLIQLQFGYQKGKAIIVAPLYTVMCIIIPALTGIVLFHEWHALSLMDHIIKYAGLGIIIFGVSLLSYFNTNSTE